MVVELAAAPAVRVAALGMRERTVETPSTNSAAAPSAEAAAAEIAPAALSAEATPAETAPTAQEAANRRPEALEAWEKRFGRAYTGSVVGLNEELVNDDLRLVACIEAGRVIEPTYTFSLRLSDRPITDAGLAQPAEVRLPPGDRPLPHAGDRSRNRGPGDLPESESRQAGEHARDGPRAGEPGPATAVGPTRTPGHGHHRRRRAALGRPRTAVVAGRHGHEGHGPGTDGGAHSAGG